MIMSALLRLRPSPATWSSVLGGLSVLVFSAATLSTASAFQFRPTNEAKDRAHDVAGGLSSFFGWRSTPIGASSRRTRAVAAHPLPLPFVPFLIPGVIGRPSLALCDSTSSVERDNGVSSSLPTSISSDVDVDCDSSADPPPSADSSSPPFDTRGRKYELLRHPCRSLVDSHAIFGSLLGPGKIEKYDVYRRRGEDEDEEYSVNIGSTTSRGGGSTNETEGGFGGGAGEVAVADLRVGRRLDGHDGIVHGGIICILIDDAMGWGYDALVLTEREKKRRKRDRLVVSEKISDADGTGAGGGYETEEDIPTVVTANLSVDFRAPLPANTEAILRVNHDRTDGRKLYFSARLESVDGGTLFSEATSLFVIPRKK
mmetsp:Transcript_29546/g.87519  ORF Transcript_29546/g.87519 Transcript_29546/m.87519 type:complete len:371 (-) Transcript_29546:497-1609(-)